MTDAYSIDWAHMYGILLHYFIIGMYQIFYLYSLICSLQGYFSYMYLSPHVMWFKLVLARLGLILQLGGCM